MSLHPVAKKLGDVLTKTVGLLTDWGKEPLRKWEHERDLSRLNAESQNKTREKEVEAAIKAKEEEHEANLAIKKKTVEAAIKAKEKEHEVNLAIKKETEIKRIFVEIEEFKKDKELQRMIAVSEAIMKYKEGLTKLNADAINAIGNMQLDLREKAQLLVYDKTIKYKALQDQAIKEASDDLKRIEENFMGNEVAQGILIRAVDKRLANIIDTAQNFLLELNADIKLLNQSINLLTEHGQTFIESHLEKFHIIEATTNTIKQIDYRNL